MFLPRPRPRSNRRDFLRTAAAAGAAAGLGNLAFLQQLPAVSAAEAELDPKLVRLRPEIEPLVRLVEDTPRERLLEEVAARIKAGASYREVLAALLLAGVRYVRPRPAVGFKFHAVLVVNSAHLASLSSSDQDRWLPIFWALDHFKGSQADEKRQGNAPMGPVDEAAVPAARNARQAFIAAMDTWDEPAADAAVTALARHAGASEVYELFWKYGARDLRSIGHKAIYVANSWRTLQCIGWQHAEPVLRSLAFALLNHEREDNPSKNDYAADRPGRRNQELASKIRPEWLEGKPDAAATTDLLATFRAQSSEAACDAVVEVLNRGVAPASVWDALFQGSGELLLRKANIASLHAVTTTNALYYAYQATGNDETRRWLMLQSAAWLPAFLQNMRGRDAVADVRIDQLEPLPLESTGPAAVEEIFAAKDRLTSVRKTAAFLTSPERAEELIQAARRLVFLKGNDAHDYKFSSAVLEDYYHIGDAARARFLASSQLLLPHSNDRDNSLVQRTREALS